MKKETIIIKGKYIGDEHPFLKHGDPITITFIKKEVLSSWMQLYMNMQGHGDEPISLLGYVRKRVNRIYQTGSVYS
jgi:hypothetical protein